MTLRLKKFYSSREVAVLTGLSARQLQWWDSKRLFVSAIASQRTEAGGFTERRYTPMDVLELQVLADLRRRKFSIPQIRRLLSTLREVFGIRLYEAIGDDGPLALFIGGDQLYARTQDGRLYNMDRPTEPLLMVGEELPLRPVAAREARRRRAGGSERPIRGSKAGLTPLPPIYDSSRLRNGCSRCRPFRRVPSCPTRGAASSPNPPTRAW